jgi:hypothetical protein
MVEAYGSRTPPCDAKTGSPGAAAISNVESVRIYFYSCSLACGWFTLALTLECLTMSPF